MKEKNTAWILLVVSGLMEIVWAYTMKLSHGFTVLWPSVITIAILIISFFLLAKAVNTLGIGLSYAVFTGIGVVGTTLISIFVLKEGASLLKMLSLAFSSSVYSDSSSAIRREKQNDVARSYLC